MGIKNLKKNEASL